MVGVVEHVGRSMQSSDRLDLLLRNTKSKLQAIERGLHATQKCSTVNRNDVMQLLDLGGICHKLVKSGEFPLCRSPDQLGFRCASCASE